MSVLYREMQERIKEEQEEEERSEMMTKISIIVLLIISTALSLLWWKLTFFSGKKHHRTSHKKYHGKKNKKRTSNKHHTPSKQTSTSEKIMENMSLLEKVIKYCTRIITSSTLSSETKVMLLEYTQKISSHSIPIRESISFMTSIRNIFPEVTSMDMVSYLQHTKETLTFIPTYVYTYVKNIVSMMS